jgi:hypothetical protein
MELEMSEIKDEPAFPMVWDGNTRGDAYGMTLRDYFAAKSITSVMTRHGSNFDEDLVASECFVLADAMLRAREAS